MNDRRREEGLLPSLFEDSFFPVMMRNFSLFDDIPAHDLVKTKKSSNLSLWEDENNVYMEAALPGVEQNDIDVTWDKGVLWVRGNSKRHEKKEEEDRKYYYKASSQFSYHVAIPGDVDESVDPQAEFNKGILKVTFSKQKQETPKKINIQ